jgi:hypothetical protein
MQKLSAAFGSCAKFTYTDQGTTLNSVLAGTGGRSRAGRVAGNKIIDELFLLR